MAVSGPMPWAATSAGARAVVIRRRRWSRSVGLGVELGNAPGEGRQAELGDRAQVVTFGWAERGADRQQLAPAQSPQLVTRLVRAVVIRSRICRSAWVRAV